MPRLSLAGKVPGAGGGPWPRYTAPMDSDETPNYEPQDPDEAPASGRPGWTMPLLWIGLAALTAVCGGLGVGAAGYSSESAGVTASYVLTGPMCFFSGGALAAVAAHLLIKKASAGRTFAPVGCGCLSALVGMGLIVLFFAVIFPAL